jgi:hypothetical protein
MYDSLKERSRMILSMRTYVRVLSYLYCVRTIESRGHFDLKYILKLQRNKIFWLIANGGEQEGNQYFNH